MEQSPYGKDLSYFLKLEKPLSPNQVFMHEVDSSFEISPQVHEKIEREWFEEKRGTRPKREEEWRYECFDFDKKGLHIFVSPTFYVWHNILRKGNGIAEYVEMPVDKNTAHGLIALYPTPITVNSIPVTTDGFIPIAVRKTPSAGGTSDQLGLCALGSGFFGRFVKNGKNLPPNSPFSVAYRENHDESCYDLPCPESAFNIQNAKLLGLIRGSNTDITASIYTPLDVSHSKVHLNPDSKEHSDLWFLPTDHCYLQKFLEEGGMNRAKAADHLLGDIELFMINKTKL